MLTILQGDCIERMKSLPDECAQCCITSPPYWTLRDYGDPGQIGVEKTPEDYVARLVEVFREVRRLLNKNGTLWLNLGDTYNAYNGNRGTKSKFAGDRAGMEPEFPSGHGLAVKTLKQKDLVGIPWMVAFALRSDGWYLRQDNIWHKPNPMPESVTDRCTKAHEYMFLLSKSSRYYFDAEAIKEPGVIPAGTKAAKGSEERANIPGVNSRPPEYTIYDGMRNKRSVWTVTTACHDGEHRATFPKELIVPCVLAGSPPKGVILDPFAGSGTTGEVALENGRQAILIEINPKYVREINRRLLTQQIGLAL